MKGYPIISWSLKQDLHDTILCQVHIPTGGLLPPSSGYSRGTLSPVNVGKYTYKLKSLANEVSSNSIHTVTFTFRLITIEKIWTSLSLQQWVKLYHCCSSTWMTSALNKPRKLMSIKRGNQTKTILRKYVSKSLTKGKSW